MLVQLVLLGAAAPLLVSPRTTPAAATGRPVIQTVTILHYHYKNGRFKKRYRQVKTYNPRGKILVDRYTKPSGRWSLQWRYTYNRKNELVRMVYRERKRRRRLTRRYRYKYDQKGRVAERIMSAPEMKSEFRDVYTYDAAGGYRVLEYRKYLPTGNEYRSGSRAYNAAGKMTRHCSPNSCAMNEYDRRGNLRRVRHQLRSRGGRHFYRVYTNKYNAAGRLIQVTVGGSKRTYTYNKHGHKILELYTMGGKPYTKKVFTYTYRP